MVSNTDHQRRTAQVIIAAMSWVEHLKVIIKGEVTTVLRCLLLHFCAVLFLFVLLRAGHDAGLLVITNALLEEVRLACQTDVLHEVEGVYRVVDFLPAKREQQPVRDELDVLPHQTRIHAEECAG